MSRQGVSPVDLHELSRFDLPRVLRDAGRFVGARVPHITDSVAKSSEGGRHDYYSNGDYWWPNPRTADGAPFIRRDGESYPGAFHDHRVAIRSVRRAIAVLSAAHLGTREPRYAREACRYAREFFLDPTTAMTPHLRYAQAIPGICNGRGTGIIDTLHIVEVPVAFLALATAAEPGTEASAEILDTIDGLRGWFSEYLHWMRTSPNGIEERDKLNNHSVAWTVQTAVFSRFVNDHEAITEARLRFSDVHIPGQMAPDGCFPLEIERTKPYSYSLFNLDLLSTIAHVLSDEKTDLWRVATSDGRGLDRAVGFMLPYVVDKQRWPHPPDVDHFDQIPIRQPFLLFAAHGLGDRSLYEVWRDLPAETTDKEIMRNLIYRAPALWFGPICATHG
jgi:hypothetical protein